MSDATMRRWFEAARTGDLASLGAILDEHVDTNARNAYEWTALHEAAAYGRAEVVDFLIRAGADVEVVDTEGVTPLHCAARGHANVVSMLLRAGADIDARDARGTRPLHWAVANSYTEMTEVVELLVRSGADVSARDAQGRTPRDMTSPEFRASFDRIVAGVQAGRVRARADQKFRKVRRPPRPRL